MSPDLAIDWRGPGRTGVRSRPWWRSNCRTTWPWVQARADQIFRGDVGKAIVYLLRQQHAYGMGLLGRTSAYRRDDLWSNLEAPRPVVLLI
jgi:hypothetical protein